MMKKTMIVLAASLMTCSFQMKAETAREILNRYKRELRNKNSAPEAKRRAYEALASLPIIPDNMHEPLIQDGFMDRKTLQLIAPSDSTVSKKPSSLTKLEDEQVKRALEEVEESYKEVVKAAKSSGDTKIIKQMRESMDDVNKKMNVSSR